MENIYWTKYRDKLKRSRRYRTLINRAISRYHATQRAKSTNNVYGLIDHVFQRCIKQFLGLFNFPRFGLPPQYPELGQQERFQHPTDARNFFEERGTISMTRHTYTHNTNPRLKVNWFTEKSNYRACVTAVLCHLVIELRCRLSSRRHVPETFASILRNFPRWFASSKYLRKLRAQSGLLILRILFWDSLTQRSLNISSWNNDIWRRRTKNWTKRK